MITTVATVAALMTALSTAQAGDTVQLAAGTYSNIVIRNFVGGVTITSADPTHQASLKGLYVANSSGLTFQGLDVQSTGPKNTAPTEVVTSSNITFDHVTVHGAGTNPAHQPHGMLFEKDNAISVTNSQFSVLSTGMSVLDCNGVTISGDTFTDIRTNGINSSGTSNEAVSLNAFSDFHPAAKDHPDLIQFWPSADVPVAQNITIDGNTFVRGAGQPVHGIFMRGAATGPYSFSQVTISGNTFAGTGFQGINVSFAQFVTLTGNVVQAYSDVSPSWIRLQNADTVNLLNNQAAKFVFAAVSSLTETGDLVIQPIPPPAGPGAPSAMSAVLLGARVPEPGAWLLLGLGLAAAGVALRRRGVPVPV